MLAACAHVRAYDPMAMPYAHRLLAARLGPADLDRFTLAPHADDALAGADVLALATEWKEFSSPDFAAMARQLRAGAVFDGRNQYRPETVREHGLENWGVGRGSTQSRGDWDECAYGTSTYQSCSFSASSSGCSDSASKTRLDSRSL